MALTFAGDGSVGVAGFGGVGFLTDLEMRMGVGMIVFCCVVIKVEGATAFAFALFGATALPGGTVVGFAAAETTTAVAALVLDSSESRE